MAFDIRRFDIYRKVPKDLTQPTLTGAIISICCVSCITILFFSELINFLSSDIISHVYVDNPSTSSSSPDRIPVTLKVELPGVACEYLGLDIQDDLGRHEVGFVESTEKVPIEGSKGCLFSSSFHINKVPGNFHISTHSTHKQPSMDTEFTHKVLYLRFGDEVVLGGGVPQAGGVGGAIGGSFDPLRGVRTELEAMESTDYIMKVVPTVVKDKLSYQYTVVKRSFIGRGSTPAIWFRYELSPLTVKYEEKKTPIYHFLTLLCAIIGGVFTVANMIDGLIFSLSEMYRKATLDKLS